MACPEKKYLHKYHHTRHCLWKYRSMKDESRVYTSQHLTLFCYWLVHYEVLTFRWFYLFIIFLYYFRKTHWQLPKCYNFKKKSQFRWILEKFCMAFWDPMRHSGMSPKMELRITVLASMFASLHALLFSLIEWEQMMLLLYLKSLVLDIMRTNAAYKELCFPQNKGVTYNPD